MILEYLGKSVPQCTQVNDRLGRRDCCNNPFPERECDYGGWPQFEKHGLQYKTTTDAPLSWEDVKAQLAPNTSGAPCHFTPFAFTWRYTQGGGHMMIAVGYMTVNGINYVRILDPAPVNQGDPRIITYDDYVSGVTDTGQHYIHWNDYYEIH